MLVTDSPQNVTLNRTRLADQLAIPMTTVCAGSIKPTPPSFVRPAAAVEADALSPKIWGGLCGDDRRLPPVLFCDEAGDSIGRCAGWRGLAGGILEKTVHQFWLLPGLLIRLWRTSHWA